MSDLAEIEALFFALVGGSPGAEVVFLNENLAVRLGVVFRDFDALPGYAPVTSPRPHRRSARPAAAGQTQ